MSSKSRTCPETWPGQSQAPIRKPHPEHQCARPVFLSPVTNEWWHPGQHMCWCGAMPDGAA